MRNRTLLVGALMAMSLCSLTGCSKLKSEMKEAMANNQEIKLSVDGEVTQATKPLTWGELDQLTSYTAIRDVWDDELQIIKFEYGSKNGMIFIDLQGNWAGNNTLYNAFQNKEFSAGKWDDNKVKSKFAEAAMAEFSDLTSEGTGIYGSVNAYFNILPANADGTSGLMNDLSRAQVMTAIYRGDTPVTFNEEKPEFKEAVGTSQYNVYAQEVADISYLKYQNKGLNYDTYNSPCTRAEALYMLVQRYFKNDYDNVDVNSITFSDCKNGGDILKKIGATEDSHAVESYELEWCLQNPEDGCPEALYKALVVARNKGLLNSNDTRWNDPILFGELINFMIKSYTVNQDGHVGYLVNAKTGANAGRTVFVAEQEVDTDIGGDIGIGGGQLTNVRDITDLNDLLKVYGNEIDMTDDELAEAYENASKFHFEAIDKFMMVDFCSALNVRTGPTTDFRILSSVPKGTKVHVVAFCKETGWYRIIANKKIVYQCEVYFSEFEGADQMLKESEANSNAQAFDAEKAAEQQPEKEENTVVIGGGGGIANPYTINGKDNEEEILATDVKEISLSDIFSEDNEVKFDEAHIKLKGTVADVSELEGVYIVTIIDSDNKDNKVMCYFADNDEAIEKAKNLEEDSIVTIYGIGYTDGDTKKLYSCYDIEK